MTEPEFLIAIIGMAFVIVLMSGIFTYAWHETKRKERFKLQKERETTLREMAAYVAEGTISPDDAERLIRAMGETDQLFVGSGVASAAGGAPSPGAPPRPSPA